MFCFGPYGLRASEVNCCSYPYGRMGQNTILAKPHRLRIPQFAGEVTYRLGIVSTRKPPFLPLPPSLLRAPLPPAWLTGAEAIRIGVGGRMEDVVAVDGRTVWGRSGCQFP
jgi:hypothetical protein